MLDIITSIYVFPLFGVCIGLLLYHYYHKLCDDGGQQRTVLTHGDYVRVSVFLYVIGFSILFLHKNAINVCPLTSCVENELQPVTPALDNMENSFNTGLPSF